MFANEFFELGRREVKGGEYGVKNNIPILSST